MSNFLEKDVLKAFQKGILAAVAVCDDPTLSIKMRGVTFDPKDAQEPGKYIEVVHIPNNLDGQYWGDERIYRGIFRLILHWSNEDDGAYPPLDLLGSICEFFTKNREFVSGPVSLCLTGSPNYTGDLPTGHDTLYPVSIRYTYFQP